MFKIITRFLIYLTTINYILFPGFLFTADKKPGFSLIVPSAEKITTQRTFHHIVGKLFNNDIQSVECSYPFDLKKTIPVLSKEEKDNFPKQVQSIFPADFYINYLQVEAVKSGNFKKNRDYKFNDNEKIDLKKFWSSIEFRKVLALAYNDSVIQMTVSLKGFKVIKISVSNSEYIQKWQNIFVFNIPLHTELNIIKLRAITKNADYLKEKTLQIYSNPNWFDNDKIPANFVSYTFHDGKQETNCTTCHDMKIEKKIERDATNLSCQQCHNEFNTQKYQHTPVENGACFECHIADSQLQILETRDDAPLCESCHSDLLKSDDENIFIHSPVQKHECIHCHDAHSSAFSDLTHQPILNTCLSCHDKKLEKDHPLFGHPVTGESNPLDDNKEFNCISCHQPHLSNTHLLLKKEASCKACHKK